MSTAVPELKLRMLSPSAQAELTLGRARKHLGELISAIREYESNPYRGQVVRSEHVGLPPSNPFRQVDSEASLIFGDLIHCLRATLDYAVLADTRNARTTL